MCPQYVYNDTYVVSEDCLFLNVYTHQWPEVGLPHHKFLPIIIYIHAGGFFEWSSNSEYHSGPEYFMDHDIIFVSFNYRLGTLGFLATKESPGNYGLKDQVLVLEWVQNYIHNFGGNPNLVTIFGYDCGGISGTLHMVSPMTRGNKIDKNSF